MATYTKEELQKFRDFFNDRDNIEILKGYYQDSRRNVINKDWAYLTKYELDELLASDTLDDAKVQEFISKYLTPVGKQEQNRMAEKQTIANHNLSNDTKNLLSIYHTIDKKADGSLKGTPEWNDFKIWSMLGECKSKNSFDDITSDRYKSVAGALGIPEQPSIDFHDRVKTTMQNITPEQINLGLNTSLKNLSKLNQLNLAMDKIQKTATDNKFLARWASIAGLVGSALSGIPLLGSLPVNAAGSIIAGFVVGRFLLPGLVIGGVFYAGARILKNNKHSKFHKYSELKKKLNNFNLEQKKKILEHIKDFNDKKINLETLNSRLARDTTLNNPYLSFTKGEIDCLNKAMKSAKKKNERGSLFGISRFQRKKLELGNELSKGVLQKALPTPLLDLVNECPNLSSEMSLKPPVKMDTFTKIEPKVEETHKTPDTFVENTAFAEKGKDAQYQIKEKIDTHKTTYVVDGRKFNITLSKINFSQETDKALRILSTIEKLTEHSKSGSKGTMEGVDYIVKESVSRKGKK